MWVLVLGMHRSGTSALAGVLRTAGFNFGQLDQAMPANDQNPKGFWERMDVVILNDTILKTLGCEWDRLSRYDAGAVGAASDPAWEESIRGILGDVGAGQVGFLKDPRLCLTLPLWLRVQPPAAIIWIMRHPLAVARSLVARGDCSLMTGLALWEFYNRMAGQALGDRPCLRVCFEDIQRNPENEIQRILHYLAQQGLTVPAPSGGQASWYEPGMVHHEQAPEDVALVPPCVQQLWGQLSDVRGALPDLSWAEVSAFTREALRYHDQTVRAEQDHGEQLQLKVDELRRGQRLAEWDIQQYQQQLAALATSCQALEDSQLWRMTRMLHRAWCRLSGNPGHRTPLEHMQMILRDHKPRGG